MNDHDLREMFRRRESDATLPAASPPAAVVRRARRRQVGTVLIAATVTIALVTVPVAGLRLLRSEGDDLQTPGKTTVVLPPTTEGLRSAALPYASIAYPEGWLLTDTSPLTWMGPAQPGPIVSGPVLQLSNFDPDLHDSPRCMFDDDPIPDDGVMLSVGIQATQDTTIPAPTDDWPVDLGPYPPNTDPECDQGVDLTVGWVAPSGVLYWANATLGSDSSQADRAALKTAFASMLFPPSDEPWMSTFSADQGQGSPRLILDTAVFQGVPLSLVVYLDHYKAPWIGVSAPLGNFLGGGAIGVGTGSGRPEPVEVTMNGTPTGALVWGDAALDVARAAFNTQDGQTLPATIVKIPSTAGVGRNAVWGFVDGATGFVQGLGYDAAGNLLGDPTLTTAPPDVIASGTDPEGGQWTLSITHSSLGEGFSFSWDGGSGGGSCCLNLDRLDGEDLRLDGFSSGGNEPAVITAFASTRVASVVAQLPDGTVDGQLFPMPAKYIESAQMVVVIVPSNFALKGDLVASDADGNVLAMVPIDGGPTEEPSGVTPEIDEVFQDLYAARDATQKYFSREGTFDGIDLASLSKLAPFVSFDRSATAVPHEVSVRVSAQNELVVVSTTEDGAVYCIGVQIDAGGGGNFYYGQVDASGFDACRGDWGLPPIGGS
jgi:hypothetical protein